MNRITIIITLLLMGLIQNIFSQNSELSRIEKSLHVKTPADLRNIWRNSNIDLENRTFRFGAYSSLYFLFPGDSIPQFNGRRKKSICEFTHDIYGNGKILVFATSIFEEAFINIFYKFKDSGEVDGIYISNEDQGTEEPIKIGNNLDEVFPDIIKCFTKTNNQSYLENLLYDQTQNTIFDNTMAIFPKKNLFLIFDLIMNEKNFVIYQDNNLIFIEDSIKKDITNLYLKIGIDYDFSEPLYMGDGRKVTFMYDLIDELNNRLENDSNDVRIFNITFNVQGKNAVALCSKKQAQRLNNYGLIRFTWRDRSIKEHDFMYK